VELKPALAEGHYILGVIYRQAGNTTAALAEFGQVITLTSDAKLKSEAEKQVAEIGK
jgi:lipoprotein NlpI